MMQTSTVAVDFPLKGEWVACATPAAGVPSHGTDAYGQRYAFDFYRVDRTTDRWQTCRSWPGRYYGTGLPLGDFYAWGEPVYAPFTGRVEVASDGWPERSPVQYLAVRVTPALDSLRAVLRGRRWDSGIAGNHVIVKKEGVDAYAFLAHLQKGSVLVEEGARVEAGELLARVGQSGRSSEPHLHFHLMDRADLQSARGLPCCFRHYEALEGDGWVPRERAVPDLMQPIRSVEPG